MSHDIENIKKNTISELEEVFKSQSIYNLGETYDVFMKIIERYGLDKLKKSLLFPTMEHKIKDIVDARKDFADELENYIKYVYKVMSIDINGNLGACFNKFWKDFGFLPNGGDRNKFFEKDVATDKIPAVNKEYFKGKIPFGIEQKGAYDMRNALIHGGKLFAGVEPTSDTATADLKGFVALYLFITHKYLPKLKTIFESEETPDFEGYCDGIIRDSKSKTKYYVALNIREELEFNNASKKNKDQAEETFGRRGEIHEIIASNLLEKKMILWADAGMGKTTSLEYLTWADAKIYKTNKASNIPVYILLGSLVDSSLSLLQAIANKLNIVRDELIKLLSKGKINLYLDALNEAPTHSLKTLRTAEITQMLGDFKQAQIVVSNRPMDVNYFKEVPIFRLEKMNDKQVEKFIEKYSDGDLIFEKNILEKIASSTALRENVRRPLMLSCLIEIVKSDGGVIPESEGEIIDRYIHVLYKREKVEKKDAQFNEDYIHQMLSYLGNHSFDKDSPNVDDVSPMLKNEINIQLRDSLKWFSIKYDPIYVLAISTRLNILEEIDTDTYVFAYPNFRDYYKNEFYKIESGI